MGRKSFEQQLRDVEKSVVASLDLLRDRVDDLCKRKVEKGDMAGVLRRLDRLECRHCFCRGGYDWTCKDLMDCCHCGMRRSEYRRWRKRK